MGADDAVNIILNAKYAGKTEVGNSKDATSLDNMLNAIRWMKSVNDYRKSVGLSELQVTYKLIAGAIADANYSDTVLDHARQYDFAENLAWNYGIDPSGQWIEQEKGFFDKATETLYGVTGLVGKDAYDFYAKNGVAINHWIANNCRWKNGSSGTVGHYMNIINPELAVMGMATCTKGTMSGLQTQCYTAEISGWSGSGWNTNPISVDEYEQKLTSYIDGLKNAKSALDAAKADLAAKQQATVQQKQVAADSAQAGIDAAKQDVTDAQRAVDAARTGTGVAADKLTGSQTDLEDAQSNLDILTGLAAKLAEAQRREQDAVKAVNDTKAALDSAKADTIAAESLVSAAEQVKAQADAKLSKLNSIDAGAAIASGHDVNADDALNALFAAAVEARAKVAPAKAILDEKQAAVDGLQPGYDAALAAYEQAKSDRIAAEQELSAEIARQEAEEAAKKQAAYSPKHLAGTETAQSGSLAQTGDRAGLIGETFVIGGTVLVATGVFLDRKKRREQM